MIHNDGYGRGQHYAKPTQATGFVSMRISYPTKLAINAQWTGAYAYSQATYQYYLSRLPQWIHMNPHYESTGFRGPNDETSESFREALVRKRIPEVGRNHFKNISNLQ